MALILSTLGNPNNQVGGPGSNRAKWKITDDGVAPGGGTQVIDSAAILAALNNPTVPAEFLAIVNAPYASDDAAESAVARALNCSLYVYRQDGSKAYHITVTRDGVTSKPQINVIIDAGATALTLLLEVVFHHSETR
jgi:hypothetical protein